jgi:hypothetical protein
VEEELKGEKCLDEEEKDLELLESERMDNLDTVKEKGGCGD